MSAEQTSHPSSRSAPTNDELRLLVRSGLSFREFGVLERLACGLTNEEIAAQLGVSVHTIKNHVHRLLSKLRADSRADLMIRFGPAGRA